jgi:hypothetical protein
MHRLSSDWPSASTRNSWKRRRQRERICSSRCSVCTGATSGSGEQEGLVFNDERKPFLDKAHYIVEYVGDAGTATGYCFKTFTMKDGDQVVARCDWRGQEGGSAGTVTILGGTGKYAGIRGKGTFKFTSVSPVVNWDILEIDYEFP